MEDQFDKDESMYTITCVTPLSTKEGNIIAREKLEEMDKKILLESCQTMVKELKVSYRNSKEIQLLYNVYHTLFSICPTLHAISLRRKCQRIAEKYNRINSNEFVVYICDWKVSQAY